MAEELHAMARVEQRMAAVETVGTIMRAVWALARAQLPQVEAAAAEATAFVDVADAIVTRLAGAPATDIPHDEVLWVLLGPERPFCGPLARMLLEQLPAIGAVGLVGQRLSETAKQQPDVVARVVFEAPGATTPDELGVCADRLATEILAVPGRTVVLLHPHRGSPTLHRSVVLAQARAPVDEPPETFLPPVEVLTAAVTEAVAGRLAVALAEALRAEVRARVVAAEAARQACDRKLDEMQHQWRALRQRTITEELLEIAAARPAKLRHGL